MKKFIFALCLMGAANANASTTYDFTADFDFANWSAVTESNGSVNTVSNTQLVMTSADDGSWLEQTQYFTTTLQNSGSMTFDWSFVSSDSEDLFFGEAFGDSFGYYVNSSETDLTTFQFFDLNNAISGTETLLNLQAGDQFGFFQRSIDSDFGAATTTISGFEFESVTAVPEPSTYALMIGGLGLVGLMAARRKKI